MVAATPRIEASTALGTHASARQIFVDSKLTSTCAAQNGYRVARSPRPRRNRVIRYRIMTILARVELAAALELDRDDVEWRTVVSAPRLAIQADSPH